MTLAVTCKCLPDEMEGSEDDQGRRFYRETFEIAQTDGGSLAAPVAMAAAAQSVMTGDPLPLRGDNYSRFGTTDADSYVLKFNWKKPFSRDDYRIIQCVVDYGPASGTDPGRLAEPNPLLWPTEYWLEWTEESLAVKDVRVVDDLTHIGRAANSVGPIINGAGEEPIDTQMKTIRYPILCCQKAYETLPEIAAINLNFQDTTNDGGFFGATERQCKFLSTESGRIQRTQGQSYYLGVTKIWFKKLTWDLQILNIGFNELQKIRDGDGLPTSDYRQDKYNLGPQLYRCMVQDYKINDDGSYDILETWSPSSEALKLDVDGTRLQPTSPASYLVFRDLEEVDYAGIGIGS